MIIRIKNYYNFVLTNILSLSIKKREHLVTVTTLVTMKPSDIYQSLYD